MIKAFYIILIGNITFSSSFAQNKDSLILELKRAHIKTSSKFDYPTNIYFNDIKKDIYKLDLPEKRKQEMYLSIIEDINNSVKEYIRVGKEELFRRAKTSNMDTLGFKMYNDSLIDAYNLREFVSARKGNVYTEKMRKKTIEIYKKYYPEGYRKKEE